MQLALFSLDWLVLLLGAKSFIARLCETCRYIVHTALNVVLALCMPRSCFARHLEREGGSLSGIHNADYSELYHICTLEVISFAIF